MEARQPYSPEEDTPEGVWDFSLEADTAMAEEDILGNRRGLAEIFVRNPAFKSEKAQRALRKLKEAWRAAEENIPEELRNELRHERRDASTSQEPVHISSIVAGAPARQPGLASLHTVDDENDILETDEEVDFYPEDDEPKISKSRTVSIYKQAVISGFVMALVLVIVFMLFLVMR